MFKVTSAAEDTMKLLTLGASLLFVCVSAFGQTATPALNPNPAPLTTSIPTQPTLDWKSLYEKVHAQYKVKDKTFFYQESQQQPQGYGVDQVTNLWIFQVRTEVITRQAFESRYVVRYGKPTIWLPWRLRPTGQVGMEKILVNHREFSSRRINIGIVKRF